MDGLALATCPIPVAGFLSCGRSTASSVVPEVADVRRLSIAVVVFIDQWPPYNFFA